MRWSGERKVEKINELQQGGSSSNDYNEARKRTKEDVGEIYHEHERTHDCTASRAHTKMYIRNNTHTHTHTHTPAPYIHHTLPTKTARSTSPVAVKKKKKPPTNPL